MSTLDMTDADIRPH